MITEHKEQKFKVATLTRNLPLESEKTLTFKTKLTTADVLQLAKMV